ncbi:MAG: phospholipid carrier-dependent glycosyltransferase [Candidatus Omnitrophica bacterium]|nr:phospholipid carrier-dependent glycosyltransferase [Candidatus Omnitrophota bacterium]
MTWKTNIVIILLLYCVSFLIIALPIIKYPIEFPFQLEGDELGFYQAGTFLFRVFFIEQDFSSNVWGKIFGNYGSCNPRVGLYIIGFFDLLASYFNSFVNAVPKIVILRLLMATLSAGSVISLFILVRMTASLHSGIIAVALLLTNPIFRGFQCSILPDVPMFFFSLLSLIAFMHVEKNLKQHVFSWKWFFLSGICMGLAISSKLYAASLGACFFVIIVQNRNHASFKKVLLGLLLVFGSSSAIFILSNPLLYTNIFQGIRILTTEHIATHNPNRLLNLQILKEIVTFPFVLFKRQPFIWSRNVYYETKEFSLIAIGYIIFGMSLIKTRFKRDYLMLLWIASSISLIAFVMIFMPSGWLVFKLFILPVIGIIWLISCNVPKLYEKVFMQYIAREYNYYLVSILCASFLLFLTTIFIFQIQHVSYDSRFFGRKMSDNGIVINVKSADIKTDFFALCLNRGNTYELIYYQKNNEVARQRIEMPGTSLEGLDVYVGTFLQESIERTFDSIKIIPAGDTIRTFLQKSMKTNFASITAIPDVDRESHRYGYFYLMLPPQIVKYSEIQNISAGDIPNEQLMNIILEQNQFLAIELEKTYHARLIELSIDSHDSYRIIYLQDNGKLGESNIRRHYESNDAPYTQVFGVPDDIALQGYNKLLIIPLLGDGVFCIQQLHLKD